MSTPTQVSIDGFREFLEAKLPDLEWRETSDSIFVSSPSLPDPGYLPKGPP